MENKNLYIIAGVVIVVGMVGYGNKKKAGRKNESVKPLISNSLGEPSSGPTGQFSQAPQQGIVESASLDLNARAEQEAARDAQNVRKFEERVQAEYRQIVNKQFTRQEFNELSNKVMSQQYRYPEDLMAAYLDLRNKIMLSSTNRVAQDEMLSSLDQKYGAKADKMDKLQYKGFGIESKGERFVLKMNR